MLKTLLLLYVHNIPRDEMKKREAESKWCLVMSHQHAYIYVWCVFSVYILHLVLSEHSFVTTFLMKLVEYE